MVERNQTDEDENSGFVNYLVRGEFVKNDLTKHKMDFKFKGFGNFSKDIEDICDKYSNGVFVRKTFFKPAYLNVSKNDGKSWTKIYPKEDRRKVDPGQKERSLDSELYQISIVKDINN